jgi:hypothetical protein
MTNNNTLSPEVLADISKRVVRVQSYLQTSSESWLAVAEEFSVAKKKLSTKAYQRFAIEAGFTTNVAEKLQKVGSQSIFYDPQIKKYLASADGWTVLYELAKLDQSKINTVIDHLKTGSKKLTRDFILNIANNRSLDEKTIVLASLEVTSSKLASLTQQQYADVNRKIAEIEQIISTKSTVVAFRKREKSLQSLAQKAEANNAASLVSTKSAA